MSPLFAISPLEALEKLIPKKEVVDDNVYLKFSFTLQKYFRSSKEEKENLKSRFPEYKKVLEEWEPYESNFFLRFFASQQFKYCLRNN